MVLRNEATALCADPRFRDALWRHCTLVEKTRIDDLNTRIHPDDQMLEHSLRAHRDAKFAVSQYFGVALQQHSVAQQLLRQAFPGDWRTRKILDFACGYGRHLRFLTMAVPSANVWGAEILPEAVEFVRREFGVHAVASELDPRHFQLVERFDFIWVASLFSHLPDPLFRGWMERLLSLMTEDGLLCFTTHDAWELPADQPMPAAGIAFAPRSENERLTSETYGTTFVTEQYVRNAVANTTGGKLAIRRIPRALAAHQDLYVVTRDSSGPGSQAIRKGAWGWVDLIQRSTGGELYLAGWAASLDDGAIGEAIVTIDGRRYRCATSVSRPDVVPVVGDDRCGFELRTPVGTDDVFVEVSAPARSGESALLYAGIVKGQTLKTP